MIRSGQLRHRVSLSARQAGQDEWGQPIEAFVEYATDWAEINQTGGREFFNAQHFIDQTDLVLRMRYRADLHAAHRITLPVRSEVYEVLAVGDPDMRHRELFVLAKLVET